ncbi:hypothetical protein PCASD_04233 [Puccinia coronata f. sp. avenae]|uniref:Uncharacterized protein n=1 Tax=Puccinia coronata f. sp. avenae TaxID=200324 RepID=A0A2N5VEV9_9BASI|nr:hypothetical protein PCASD_19831 [Puccinia coronata f. sp. avenae]PLW48523.1 hypothetical protein PCASD_04230 [Puccinia coronata f. sp. avenae]PLW48525.1 hypothetical protein PCASD_04233 [Puccinia coronata f. sp. avenae]
MSNLFFFLTCSSKSNHQTNFNYPCSTSTTSTSHDQLALTRIILSTDIYNFSSPSFSLSFSGSLLLLSTNCSVLLQ